ncbi:phage tail fiber protein [Enterobacter hormaechei]
MNHSFSPRTQSAFGAGSDGGSEGSNSDRNKQPLVWLDSEVNADGSVLVKAYHEHTPEAPTYRNTER